jgi:hypothetical protein
MYPIKLNNLNQFNKNFIYSNKNLYLLLNFNFIKIIQILINFNINEKNMVTFLHNNQSNY